MEGGRSRRRLAIVIAAALAAVAAGVAVGLVLAGGDDDEKRSASAPTTTTQPTTQERTARERTETTTTTSPTRSTRHDQALVERTVVTFVESAELEDSRRACPLVAGGAGQRLPGCAARAGIDPRQLPSSDELQVDSVNVSGAHATAKLSNGSSFSLQRSGGKWRITGFKPFRG